MRRILLSFCALVLVAALASCGAPPPRGRSDAGGSPPSETTTIVAGATTTTSSPATTAVSGAGSGSAGSGAAGSGAASSGAGSAGGGPGVDPAVVPKVITVAYVDAVFAKLDAIYGNALRSALAARQVTQRAIADLYAIFDQQLARTAVGALGSLSSHGFPDVRRNPGNQMTRVVTLIQASPHCVFARVAVDYSAVDLRPPGRVLAQYEGLTGRGDLNVREGDSTPWAIFYDNVLPDGGRVPDQCALHRSS